MGRIGHILIGGVAHDDALAELRAVRAAGLPVVSIFDDELHPSIPNVGSDQRAVAALATRHLIERGARKLCHIHSSDARYEGFLSEIRAAGLPGDERRVFHVTEDIVSRTDRYNHAVGMCAVREFLARGIDFDGIVAASDNQAVACVNELTANGIRVPADVRVTGIDNAPFCEFTRTTLTSVSQEFRPRAELAMRLLLRCIDGKPGKSLCVDPVLHARQSTA